MPRMTPGSLCRAALLATALGCTCLVPRAEAQLPAPAAPSAPAAFDPSDVYFQGWLLSKDADTLDDEGQHLGAIDKLRRAREMFRTIQRTFPDWKPDMVEHRMKKTDRRIAEIMPQAVAEQRRKDAAVAELEGGARQGVDPRGVGGTEFDRTLPEAPIESMREVETLDSRRISELESEVTRLKRQIQAMGNPNGAAREAARAADLERQRDAAVAELHRARTELQQLRQRSGREPMQGELRALSERIAAVEKDKAAMEAVLKRALAESQKETAAARAQVDAINVERARLMEEIHKRDQQLADAQRNLELERQTANEVVAGQRKQIEHYQKLLAQNKEELARANQRIASLESELAEVREAFDELRDERDDLLRERDQMAALLNLTEGGQLQQVIDQNMALDRKLREAEKRYETLKEDYDSSSEDLKVALRDLSISKLRIQQFRRERLEQEKRIESLEDRLRLEDRALAEGEGDPAEVAMLRGIIDRQLKIQRKRRDATKILTETLAEKAKDDPSLLGALATLQGAELNLTEEERAIIDAREVDGVLVSPYARPRSEVERAIAGRRAETAPFDKAGVRAYQNGRLHAAREAFEMIIERNPGDTGAMCKLGLVEYKLEPGFPAAAAETFRRATEVDPDNPYAQRMLGHTLALVGERGEALRALERSVELAPTRADGHLELGILQYRLGNYQAAEEAFRTTIACDETLYEPHNNLAVLYARLGNLKQGREAYRRALALGAPPNLALDERLRNGD